MEIFTTLIVLLVISSVVQFLKDLAQRQRDNGYRPLNQPANPPMTRGGRAEIFDKVKPAEDFEQASLMERKKATQHWEGPQPDEMPAEQVVAGAEQGGGPGLLGNFPNGVVRGIIWSEILQPPKAKRRRP